MSDNGYTPKVKRLGVKDEFVEHGTPEELYRMLGLDAEGLSASIREAFQPVFHVATSSPRELIEQD
jgi:deoxyxylulose-5-phosphate synthase